MKYYTIQNDKIIELSKANLNEIKRGMTGHEALDFAKKNHLRLPFIFEVVKDIETNKNLKQILTDGWIWTGEQYNGCLSGLSLNRNLYLYSYWHGLADSFSAGRVVFVKGESK